MEVSEPYESHEWSYKRKVQINLDGGKSWYRIIFDIEWGRMSEANTEDKAKKQDEKKNTDAWKEKQAQKKKAKEQQAA